MSEFRISRFQFVIKYVFFFNPNEIKEAYNTWINAGTVQVFSGADLKGGGCRLSPPTRKLRRRLTITEIHLCSLSWGHNSSPGRGGGGRRGHHFATCRPSCRCYVSRHAVKRLLISDGAHASRRPGAAASTRAQRAATCTQSFHFSPSRCFVEVRARRSPTETCARLRCLGNS